MVKARMAAALVTAGLTVLGTLVPASAQTGDKFSPTYKSRPEDVDAVLNQFRPRQDGVDYGKPSPEEQKACTMKLIVGEKPNTNGWLLLDPQGRPLRRFFSNHKGSDGKNRIDVWSYYKDGVEVYREVDTDYNDKPDYYRWFNAGGSKWGVDMDQDGKIDGWRMISAEEAAQEVYLAVVTRDVARLKALLITDAELAALKLPDAYTARIRTNLAKFDARFKELCDKTPNLSAQATFVRVESAVPQCVPADLRGPAQDVLRFPSRAILYQGADKKHEWLHTGEMFQVGSAWRITDVPGVTDVIDAIDPPVGGGKEIKDMDPAFKKLMDDLMALDKNPPASPPTPGKYPAVVDYNLKRVALLEQIVAKDKDKDGWLRQILDNLCTAHQANEGDNALLTRLQQYKNQIVASAPGSSLAGYAHYREMWARFALPLFKGNDVVKTQREWTEELQNFVTAYPKADDAPDALRQLAMNSEYSGKDKQEEAKKYYNLLATNHPDHLLAPMARGAVKRLDLNGKPLELSGPTLQGGSFDIATYSKKVVVVYYWASNCKICVGDFAVLKQLKTTFGANLEIVTVNLDETAAAANQFLSANPLPATHLFQATDQARGMESPLAVQYGIVGLPTMMLVGKDGRVIDRAIQVNELEEAVRKAL
jgi:thiol-disulfide isomerase/thioredoxin